MTPLVDLATALAPILAPITLGYGTWYGLVCWAKPFTACRRCQNTGHTTTRGLFGTHQRVCRACHGTGLRLRTGRAIANVIRRAHAGAHH